MEDFDTTTLLIIAVVIVLVLKPDLLDSLFGSSSSSSSSGPPPGYAPGAGALQPPPPAGWGGHAAPPSADKAIDDFNRKHPCPTGLVFNTATQQCETPLRIGATNVEGWSVTAPSPCGFVTDANGYAFPAPCPEAVAPRSEGAPDSVANVKAANRTAGRFTPFG